MTSPIGKLDRTSCLLVSTTHTLELQQFQIKLRNEGLTVHTLLLTEPGEELKCYYWAVIQFSSLAERTIYMIKNSKKFDEFKTLYMDDERLDDANYVLSRVLLNDIKNPWWFRNDK